MTVNVKLAHLLSVIALSFVAASFVPAALSTQVERNWVTVEGQHCIIYYEDNIDAWFKENVLQIVALADDGVANVIQILNISYNGKMEYYFFSSAVGLNPQERVGVSKGRLFAIFPPQQMLQVSMSLDELYMSYLNLLFTHETVHAMDYVIGANPLIFFEAGLERYVYDNLDESESPNGGHHDLDSMASGICEACELIPLNREIYNWSSYRDYWQAGSFTKFLIKTYGLENFKHLFNLSRSLPMELLFEEIYSRAFATVEENWITYLESYEPKVNVSGATSLVLRNGMDALIVYGDSHPNSTQNELTMEAAENVQKLSQTLTYLKYGNRTTAELAPASAVASSELASKNLVLVGNALTNPVLAEVCQYLPLTVENSHFTFNDRDYTEKTDSIVLSYLNPYNTSKYVIILGGNSAEETLELSEILLTYFQTFSPISSHYMVFEDQIITSEGYFESFELKTPPPNYGIIIAISILVSILAIFTLAYRWTKLRKTHQKS